MKQTYKMLRFFYWLWRESLYGKFRANMPQHLESFWGRHKDTQASDLLADEFIFSETPEGFDFWWDQNERYMMWVLK